MAYIELSRATLEAICVGGLPPYCAFQVWTLLALRGGCRFAALLPILIAASLIASSVDALSTHAGPSAVTLMLFAPVAAAYLVGLAGLSAIVHLFDWRDETRTFATH